MKQRLIYAVLLLAIAAVGEFAQPFRHVAVLAQRGCQTFEQTGQVVCGKFLTYWHTHGGLAQQGYPIGPEITEVSELNGQPYTVQYFERAVFELHPENQPPYDVLLSQLGTSQAKRRYGDPPKWPGAPTPTPVPPPPPGIGAQVTVLDGVTLTFRTVSNRNFVGCGSTLEWEFRAANTRDEPVSLLLDAASVSVVDSTARRYGPFCSATGAFANPKTVPGKSEADATIRVAAEQLTPSATYVDLRFTVSGKPLVFRFSLR